MDTCPRCGREFSRISQHWAQSPECGYPKISELNWRRIVGLFLGDGSVFTQNGGITPEFRMGMINRTFLDWLDSEFGVLSNGVRFEETAKESAERSKLQDWTTTVNEENYHDLYKLYLKPNPRFRELENWYRRGAKVPPSIFELTPEIARMWYVTDGNVNIAKRTLSIGTKRPEMYIEYFDDRFDVRADRRNSIRFTVDSSEDFLRWIGGPTPGFEYKWELWNRTEYKRKMEESYKHPDQNLPRQ